MVTHTDEMIGDVIRSLKAHERWEDTVVFFSADNGGPGNEGWVSPSRWDPHVIERNWPYVVRAMYIRSTSSQESA
jgi:arylsulfatase A-like enzyme